MRILINAISARRGGGQTYLNNLIARFPNNLSSELFVIAPKSLLIPDDADNIHRVKISERLIENPIIRVFWESFILPGIVKEMNIDIIFCPGSNLGIKLSRQCKTVTTFQNMLPFDKEQRKKYPLGYMRFRNWILEKTIMKSLCRSDLVIFISEYAMEVIKKLSKDKIKSYIVLPHGIDKNFMRNPNVELSRPEWLPKEGYLLYVSILDVYKSQIEVVEAYFILKNKYNIQHKLVFVGPEYIPYAHKVRKFIKDRDLEKDVIIINEIQHDVLPAIYQNAVLNIFASKTENCPFILLEALAAGRPLVVSALPPMLEFGGDAVEYFDPNNPLDLSEKIFKILHDEELMIKMSHNALQQSNKYDWDDVSKQTWSSIIQLGKVAQN